MSPLPAVPTDLESLDPVSPLHCFQLDRRNFLKVFGGGLLVCLTGENALAQESGRAFGGRQQVPGDVSAWIHIDADGHVSVFTGKVEVGQNIRTSLAQLVAEELMLPFDAITMVMGDTDLVPYDMGTFGSQSTPQMGPRLRSMAAAARQALIEMAAKQWSVDTASLTIADGKVANPANGKSFTYGQLTRGEKLVTTVSSSAPLIPASAWKVAGTAIPKANGREFVTGKHKYPSDISLPGMMFGKVLRAQGFNEARGKPVTADDVRFTTRDGAIYMVELGVPTQELRVKSLGKAARLLDRPIESIALLGSGEKLEWNQGDDALSILAPHSTPSPEALAYKITLKS